MGAGRGCIHGSTCCLAIYSAKIHRSFHLGNTFHNQCFQPFNVDALILVFFQVQALWLHPLLLFCQQIEYIFLVDFQVAAPHQILLLCIILVNAPKYMIEAVGDDAALVGVIRQAHHRVRFATTRLPVRKYSPVVTVQDRLN